MRKQDLNPSDSLSLRVRSMTWQAQDVLSLELVPLDGQPLPPFTAGAHIELQLPGGLSRSYSLLNAPSDTRRYVIGVHHSPQSRGGSRAIHQRVRAGDVLQASPPANHFPLCENAARHVMVAGGIGITPLMSMIERLREIGQPWHLFYAARNRSLAAFVPTLQAWAAEGQGELHLHFDDEQQGRVLDLPALVSRFAGDTHFYACGPTPMLAAFEAATSHLPTGQVHREYFSSTQAAASDGHYTVRLARSGRECQVNPGQTLLDALIALGSEPPNSCREGICGTCEVRVLEGIPDHRDMVLSDAERQANDRMMVCCSGAKTSTLVLDL